jgi:3-oxoacyl-[acyl-carrier protein] reductase
MTPDNVTPQLAGKRIVVTGASSGIGRAIAEAAAAAGADVLVTFRANREAIGQVVRAIEALGRRAVAVQADVASERDLDRVVQQVEESFGGADGWVNNAGADVLTGNGRSLTREAKLDLLLAVDLRGTMLASWRAADLFNLQDDGGTILNMSWDHVSRGLAGENPQLFAAVKGGVEAFSRSLARTVAPRVRVNILSPGWITTAFGNEAPEEFRQRVAQRVPLGRWGVPEDVASAAVYLLSDAARYVTGQTIMINGGDVM